MPELCVNCGRPESSHILGKCPKIGIHVEIDAHKIVKVITTKHPRLLLLTVMDAKRTVLSGVKIKTLCLNGMAIHSNKETQNA